MIAIYISPLNEFGVINNQNKTNSICFDL